MVAEKQTWYLIYVFYFQKTIFSWELLSLSVINYWNVSNTATYLRLVSEPETSYLPFFQFFQNYEKCWTRRSTFWVSVFIQNYLHGYTLPSQISKHIASDITMEMFLDTNTYNYHKMSRVHHPKIANMNNLYDSGFCCVNK